MLDAFAINYDSDSDVAKRDDGDESKVSDCDVTKCDNGDESNVSDCDIAKRDNEDENNVSDSEGSASIDDNKSDKMDLEDYQINPLDLIGAKISVWPTEKVQKKGVVKEYDSDKKLHLFQFFHKGLACTQWLNLSSIKGLKYEIRGYVSELFDNPTISAFRLNKNGIRRSNRTTKKRRILSMEDSGNNSYEPMSKRRCENSIRTPTPKASKSFYTFQVGDEICCNYRKFGIWYLGTVKKVREGQIYTVEYHDDGIIEKYVLSENIRRANEIDQLNCRGKYGPRPNATLISAGIFGKGTRVQGNYLGHGYWYDGIIDKVQNGHWYSIQYDDGDYEVDVSADRIRVPYSEDEDSDTSELELVTEKKVDPIMQNGNERATKISSAPIKKINSGMGSTYRSYWAYKNETITSICNYFGLGVDEILKINRSLYPNISPKMPLDFGFKINLPNSSNCRYYVAGSEHSQAEIENPIKLASLINKDIPVGYLKYCSVCGDHGKLYKCHFKGCGRVYHKACANIDDNVSRDGWICDLHKCKTCKNDLQAYESIYCDSNGDLQTRIISQRYGCDHCPVSYCKTCFGCRFAKSHMKPYQCRACKNVPATLNRKVLFFNLFDFFFCHLIVINVH